MKRHWNVRGMDLDQLMTTTASALDEVCEELIEDAANIVRDHGGDDEDVEAMRDLKRQQFEQCRTAQLAKLRAWLQRGGEYLH